MHAIKKGSETELMLKFNTISRKFFSSEWGPISVILIETATPQKTIKLVAPPSIFNLYAQLNSTTNQNKYQKHLKSMKSSFFLKATRSSTLKLNAKESIMIKTFGNFNTSSGIIIVSSFWKTYLFCSNKVLWISFTHHSTAFFFTKFTQKITNISKIQDLRHHNSSNFQHGVKTKPELESWKKKRKNTTKLFCNPSNKLRNMIFPDAPPIYL